MTKIIKYQQNYDGKFTVIVEGVEIDDKTMQLIDNNISVPAELKIIDPQRITGKQRRKIFALVNDIEAHTGQPRDYMRQLFQDYVKFINGYDIRISLADCSRKIAKEIIEVIIEWVFLNDIPLNYKTSDMLKENKAFLYYATVNRMCVICGKQNAELAHYQAVGRGRNRNKIDHTNNKVLALCRKHHQTQHDMGIESFNNKYHLTNSWVDVDEKLNKMLRGEKHE